MDRVFKWLAFAVIFGMVCLYAKNKIARVVSESSLPDQVHTPRPPRAASPDLKADLSKQDSRAPASIPPGAVKTETEFRKKYPGAWTITRNKQGRPGMLSGGPMLVNAKSEADIPALVQTLAPFLEVPPEQVLDKGVSVNGVTELSRTFEMKQTADGFEVIGAVIRVHARNSDGAVYIVDNLTMPIGPYNKRPAVSLEKAEEILRTKYAGMTPQIKFDRGPALWGGPNTELAWIFHVSFGASKRRELVSIVGADSGQILRETPATID